MRCLTTVRNCVIRQMLAMPSCMTTAAMAPSLSSERPSFSVSRATESQPSGLLSVKGRPISRSRVCCWPRLT
ncbi:hypothetical protein HYQ46_012119 [Verticillium longisporum]|nr:hypothetical protein HYQ46_012119 [Verticillium longisporum]